MPKNVDNFRGNSFLRGKTQYTSNIFPIIPVMSFHPSKVQGLGPGRLTGWPAPQTGLAHMSIFFPQQMKVDDKKKISCRLG